MAVAVSMLRWGLDTRACRAVKEHRDSWPAQPDLWLTWLADRIEIPAWERASRFANARARARERLAAGGRAGLTVLPWFDVAYPALLGTIVDPPIVLWTSGDATSLSSTAVAVVGSRCATPAGLTVARKLGAELADAGLVVVSGMARGVDAAAHTGCLDAGGKTVAVLGCGADVVYPYEHRALTSRAREAGAIVSEFPPGTPPLKHHFPMRNRIISGLCRAVVVIEASEKSGSLITAKAGLEQGREVLAVPGNVVSDRYRGSHALIKDGARLVETVDDVLDEIGWIRPRRVAPKIASNCLEISTLEEVMAVGEAYSVDDLARATGRSASEILAELGDLELAGRLSRSPGGRFLRLDESAIGGGRS